MPNYDYDPDERFKEGKRLNDEGKYGDAIDAFEDAILANYRIEDAYFGLYIAYKELDHLEEAEEALKRSKRQQTFDSSSTYPTNSTEIKTPEKINASNTEAKKENQTFYPTQQIETPMLLGILGAITLLVGIFLPLVTVPIVGQINYFRNGQGDGVIILIIALIAFLLALTKKYNGLYVTGLIATITTAYTFLKLQSTIDSLHQKASQLQNNPFDGLAKAVANSVQMEYGWAFLIIGICLTFAAPISIINNFSELIENLKKPVRF